MVKICELDENKLCDNCMECEMCDLVSGKVCDNCGSCLESEDGYSTLKVDEFIKEMEEKEHQQRIAKAKLAKK